VFGAIVVTNITYIACFFLGERRNTLAEKEPLVLLNKHLEFLSELSKSSKIKKAIFVLNSNTPNDLSHIEQDFLSLCKDGINNIPIEIIVRENIDFSYGAWNIAIEQDIKNKNKTDYYFLIEDDYLPTTKDFYNAYLKFVKNNVAYVASYIDYATESDHGHLARLGIEEKVYEFIPSISNGLLSASAAQIIYKKHDRIFNLYRAETYDYAVANQITFLNLFLDNRYKIDDISSQHSVPFLAIPWYGNPDGILVYGNRKKPIIIAPIHERYIDDNII
jgi:hypothetical protein